MVSYALSCSFLYSFARKRSRFAHVIHRFAHGKHAAMFFRVIETLLRAAVHTR